MARESRIKKSWLNARVNLIFYFLTLTLSFFSRKIFLNMLGNDFVGLTGTLQNLLGFLNLAELGIGSAIGYVLYKPIYDQNQTKINEIISVFGYLYRWIGVIILSLGIVLACFLPWIFPDTGFPQPLIFFAYFSFLISSLIGYFANYRQTLLDADQRNYVVTAYFQSTNIIKNFIQMGLAYYTQNLYLWVAIELGFGMIYSVVLNWKINQVYPWLRSEIRSGRELFKKYPETIKYTKQLFIHKLGGFIQWQTAPFLIYAFVSLQIVAFYGNYTMITQKLFQFVNNFLGSTGAGVGNLIAEGNHVKIKSVFWELFGIRMLVAGIICTSLFFLIEPFIALWLGPEYILGRTVLVLIIINIFINCSRGATDQFIYGYGLFWDVWSPIAEICINISVAIAGGYLWGLPGVLLGGIVSLFLIINIWKPYLLYRWGFKENILTYWKGYLKHLFLISIPAAGCYLLLPLTGIDPQSSYFNWITFSIISVLMYSSCTFLLLYLFTPGIRSVTHKLLIRINTKFSTK